MPSTRGKQLEESTGEHLCPIVTMMQFASSSSQLCINRTYGREREYRDWCLLFSCICTLSLSLSLSLSLWRLLSLQSCGDLLFAISFSLSEFMFCLSYRGSAHESVLWRACYLCRYSASRWHHARIYSSCFHSSIYSSCFHASVLCVCVSLSLIYSCCF
jgi:hypothetical protein